MRQIFGKRKRSRTTRAGLFSHRRQRSLVSGPKSCVLHCREHILHMRLGMVPRVPEQGRFLPLPYAPVLVCFLNLFCDCHTFSHWRKKIVQLGTRRVENFE